MLWFWWLWWWCGVWRANKMWCGVWRSNKKHAVCTNIDVPQNDRHTDAKKSLNFNITNQFLQ
jgi:hypothetical protein